VAAKKRPFNHPRRSAPKFGWTHLLAVLLVLVAIFFLLERLKRGYRQETAVSPPPVATLPLPQAPPATYEQKVYTSVRTAPPLRSGTVRRAGGKGDLAIIIDDMGSSEREVRELLAIRLPLTFAIIPGLPKARAVAVAAKEAGLPVMVHLPMEPQGYPQQRLEENGLLVAQSAAELTARTGRLLDAVPGAVGANNHMGSRFTEQEEKMLPVLEVLQARGLFFIDSRTTPRSVGAAVAARLGMKTATRNVFLDNEQEVAAIKKQLYAAAQLARVKGGVIAICHPHPPTIQALKEAMPELKNSGIRFVVAGELVR
jgi:polysaccharide deacetylase 2 family uncharacterized protein YibQ